jgi:hypothetical protein
MAYGGARPRRPRDEDFKLSYNGGPAAHEGPRYDRNYPPINRRHANGSSFDMPRGPPPPSGQQFGPDTDIFQLVLSLQHTVEQLRAQVERGNEENRRQRDWFEGRLRDMEMKGNWTARPAENRWTRPRAWQVPSPAKDTPTVNEYLQRTSELDDALKEGTSLAAPGALCRFVEHVGDLCEAIQPVKVHAVAADLRCGRGVAAAMIAAAGQRPDREPDTSDIGEIVKQEAAGMGTIYHLITKEKSPHKFHKRPEPFLVNVKKAFSKLAEVIRDEELSEVAMSYVCSGTDRLHRVWVLEQLHHELKDIPVTVHFYNKFESKRWKGAGQLFEKKVTVEETESGSIPSSNGRQTVNSNK